MWAGWKAIRFSIVARPPATRFRDLSRATRVRLMRPPMRRSRAWLARACIWSTPGAVAFLALTARRMLVAERRQSLVILAAICGAARRQQHRLTFTRVARANNRETRRLLTNRPGSSFSTKSPIPTNVYASAIGLCKDSMIMQSRNPSNSDF
jgi:hypothetical protein